MIDEIVGNYIVDTIDEDCNIKDRLAYKNLKLQLQRNGSYNFVPSSKILKECEGTWDISDDGDFSYFIFKYNNDKYQLRRILSLEVGSEKNFCTVYFTKEKK